MKRLSLIAAMLALAVSGTVNGQASIDLGAALDVAKKVGQSQSVGNMSEPEEIEIGRNVASSTLAAYAPVKDADLQRQLNRIGTWIAMQSERPKLPWRFVAVNSKAINAYAAPGGIIMITTGTLQQVQNEAELACVIGHEIGHINRKHHLSVLQKNLLTEAGTSALNVSSKSRVAGTYKDQLVGEGRQLFSHSLDRSAEREADEEGVLLAARAGYDPAACLSFMQRLAAMKQEVGALEELYKTHPQAKDRVVSIENALRRLDGASPGEGARPDFHLATAGKPKK